MMSIAGVATSMGASAMTSGIWFILRTYFGQNWKSLVVQALMFVAPALFTGGIQYSWDQIQDKFKDSEWVRKLYDFIGASLGSSDSPQRVAMRTSGKWIGLLVWQIWCFCFQLIVEAPLTAGFLLTAIVAVLRYQYGQNFLYKMMTALNVNDNFQRFLALKSKDEWQRGYEEFLRQGATQPVLQGEYQPKFENERDEFLTTISKFATRYYNIIPRDQLLSIIYSTVNNIYDEKEAGKKNVIFGNLPQTNVSSTSSQPTMIFNFPSSSIRHRNPFESEEMLELPSTQRKAIEAPQTLAEVKDNLQRLFEEE